MIPALLLLLQTTPVQPIVKGTGLPPPASEEGQVMAPILSLMEAIGAGDGAAVLAATIPDGRVTDTSTGADGKPRRYTIGWADYAAGFKQGARYRHVLGLPAVEVDGDIAMVWAPYTSLVDGQVAHCGYDHFDLVRTEAGWRILNATYSRRTSGCGKQP